jgi:hypothetical protein
MIGDPFAHRLGHKLGAIFATHVLWCAAREHQNVQYAGAFDPDERAYLAGVRLPISSRIGGSLAKSAP